MQEPSNVASTPSIRLSANDMAQVGAIAATVNARRHRRRKALLFGGRNAAAAAVAMAKQLRRDLFRVDLSAVVSRFIGETEKNLARVFAEASTRGAILLFDEADALFGKRTVVRDAHDRSSNREIDDLLRAITAHGGLAVLVSKPRLTLPMIWQRRFSVYEFPPRTTATRARRRAACESGARKHA
jgi:SpoVK/Ycf46/Vps4 family AAA+-type ATPase